MALQPFLDKAMERKYSGSPYEAFFTGGGLHHFENFDKQENEHIFEVRDALRNSNNLTFIRLMRDLASYHRARLAYDANDVLDNPANPTRRQMLQEIADEESRVALRRAYQNLRQANTRRNRQTAARRQRQYRAPPRHPVFRLENRQRRRSVKRLAGKA